MRGFGVGRIFGINIEIHSTWFIIFILITVSLAMSYFPQVLPGVSAIFYWVYGIFTSLLFFFSIVFHEMAHSLVARKFKVPVKRITLFVLGGVAQLEKESPSAKAELSIAIVGPIASFVLAGFFYWLGFYSGVSLSPIAKQSLFYLAFINGLLGAFNLFIFGFPLDGGRVFRAIWWHFSKDFSAATRIACRVGKGFGFLLMAGGVLLIGFTDNFIGGIWFIFIGWFLKSAADQSLIQLITEEALAGIKIKNLLEPIFIDDSAMISRIRENNWICQLDEEVIKVRERMIETRHHEFFIMDDNKVTGRITAEAILQCIMKRKNN